MDFPLAGLMDEQSCYDDLVRLLHPGGLACPRCGAVDELGVHRRHRAPVLDYQCGGCGRVFNAYTDTPLAKTRRRPSEWILLLRGICQGTSTAQLAREMGRQYARLLEVRHRMQQFVQRAGPPRAVLPDPVVEADEMYQNAGEKR